MKQSPSKKQPLGLFQAVSIADYLRCIEDEMGTCQHPVRDLLLKLMEEINKIEASLLKETFEKMKRVKNRGCVVEEELGVYTDTFLEQWEDVIREMSEAD